MQCNFLRINHVLSYLIFFVLNLVKTLFQHCVYVDLTSAVLTFEIYSDADTYSDLAQLPISSFSSLIPLHLLNELELIAN